MKKFFDLKIMVLLLSINLFVSVAAAGQIQNAGELNAYAQTTVSRQNPESGALTNVRAARNRGFDRVVFEFRDQVPSFRAEYAKPPFYYGESDATVKVAGKKFVRVTFTTASAHDLETGKSILNYKKGKLGFPAVQETAFIYDHEGMVEFVVGLKAAADFRVTQLTNPARLVIDFKY